MAAESQPRLNIRTASRTLPARKWFELRFLFCVSIQSTLPEPQRLAVHISVAHWHNVRVQGLVEGSEERAHCNKSPTTACCVALLFLPLLRVATKYFDPGIRVCHN